MHERPQRYIDHENELLELARSGPIVKDIQDTNMAHDIRHVE